MGHSHSRRPYLKPEAALLRVAAERGFAVTSSSLEGVGESDFGSDSADFWQ